jgi:hypothetical protein
MHTKRTILFTAVVALGGAARAPAAEVYDSLLKK